MRIAKTFKFEIAAPTPTRAKWDYLTPLFGNVERRLYNELYQEIASLAERSDATLREAGVRIVTMSVTVEVISILWFTRARTTVKPNYVTLVDN